MRHSLNCNHHQGCTLAEGEHSSPRRPAGRHVTAGEALHDQDWQVQTTCCGDGVGGAGRGGEGRVC